MRLSFHLLAFVIIAGAGATSRAGTAPFERGDSNGDGTLDIVDAVHTLGFLFLGTPDSIECEDAADTTDDGIIDIADPVRGLGHLFLGAPAPLSPFGDCGEDPTSDTLGCEEYPGCDEAGPRFQDGERFELGAQCLPEALVLEDLDGDGVLDLVIAPWGGGDCALWTALGNGDGTFAEASRFSAGRGFKSVVLGDFDENGSVISP